MSRIRVSALVSLSVLLAAIPIVAGAQGGQRAQRNASSASSGGQCVTAKALSNVQDCPAGNKMAKGVRTGTAPRSNLDTVDRRQEAKKGGPTGPSIEIDAATRRNRERVRSRAWELLQREVQVLQRLVRNTRQQDPRRPDILLRLAETQFEMQQALNARARSLDEPMFQARRQKNAGRFRQLKQQQQQAEQQLTQVRQESIRTYATLVQDHPDYRRMDEVLFSLAFGLEELRQFDRARQVYHRLIKGFPQSRFIPHAYLSFAEFYFNEGDMRAASQFYSKVIEFPPERNPVYGYALYKTAWAEYNLEDFRASLQKFVEVIEFAQGNPEARDAANLARQSRRELVLPYAMVGTPQRALEFFERYASNREQAMEMLESLGELYFDTGQWPKTIQVYHKLMAENPQSEKLCYWQGRVTNAVISSAPKPEQVRELQRLIDLYETWSNGRQGQAVAECKQTTAGILVWLATAWHREAIGTDTQPGTNDRNTMQQAAQLYGMAIEKFPDMEGMEFADIDRRDWPTVYKVSYYYAELLWKMEDWARCGPAFDKVVDLNPQGEFTGDAAYAAVLCYNNLYQQQYSGREREVASREGGGAQGEGRGRRGRRGRRGQQQQEEQTPASQHAPREFTPLEEGMLRAFQRYVCYVGEGEDLPTIKYRRARIYYEANRFEEAAQLFKDIAWNHRDSELSVYAANLYLDSLNVLGSMMQPARPECIQDIKASIEPLSEFYCNTDAARESHSELCEVLGQLRCDVLRKEAEAYQTNQDWKRAASTYVRIFRRYRECGRLDEVLYNAAINFEAARLLGRAIQVRKVLIERFPESSWSKRAVYLVGANYHALAFYEQAADYYEQFARRFPGETGADCTDADRTANTCPIAHEALENAVFFRLGLGDEDKAVEDARLFESNYRNRLPRETANVVYSLGSIWQRARNWPKVVDHYNSYLRRYRRQAMPQHVIRANVEIAKAYWERNDKRRAEGYFKTAVRTWQGGTPNEINGLDGLDQPTKITYIREALDATAEALFYLAEYEYAKFKDIDFPAYRGGRNLERVTQWSQREFAPWLERKRAALTAAEAEYNKIAELRVPIQGANVTLESPPWQIAAAARIGEMYRSFVDEFRDAPIPTEIENDDELYGIYVDSLDQASEPLKVQAIEKFTFCIRTATNVRWFNEWSRQCEQELNALNPREYPLAAELRSDPTFVYDRLGQLRPAELGRASEEEGLGDEGGQAAQP